MKVVILGFCVAGCQYDNFVFRVLKKGLLKQQKEVLMTDRYLCGISRLMSHLKVQTHLVVSYISICINLSLIAFSDYFCIVCAKSPLLN